MEKVLLHLQRLRRHYEICKNNYDDLALLDLSNALRIWNEIKIPLQSISPSFSKKKIFKTSVPGRKIFNLARNYTYVFAYMPTAVVTCANHGKSLSISFDDLGPHKASVFLQQFPTHSEFRNFTMIGKNFGRSLGAEIDQEIIKSHTFINWLGAEAVRCAYFNEEKGYKEFAISRGMLINRVANTLHGSHFSTVDNNSVPNKFDAPIHHLLKFKVGGLPLPYFILMKTAQDILIHSDKITGD